MNLNAICGLEVKSGPTMRLGSRISKLKSVERVSVDIKGLGETAENNRRRYAA